MVCNRLRTAHRNILACGTGLCLVLSGYAPAAMAISQGGDSTLGEFAVVPSEPFVIEVIRGEAPAKVRKEYRLINQGTQTVSWEASIEGDWIRFDGESGGQIEPGAETTVSAVLNSRRVVSLDPGTYSAAFNFHTQPDKVAVRVEGKLIVAAGSGSVSTLVRETDQGEDPVLIMGDGFLSPTQVPTTINSTAPGADAKAIAHWNVVPYQDVSSTFRFGVVAFHINGIDRVEFSLENGPWIPVSQMTYNGRSDTVEYKIALDPRMMAYTGLVEVRAVVYPTIGIARVLQPLFLNVDPMGTLSHAKRWVAQNGSDSGGNGSQFSPFRTIARAADSLDSANQADGGVILLQAGTHSITPTPQPVDTSERWLSIRPAPGLTKSDVVLVNSEWPGLRTKLLRLQNLTIRTSIPGGDVPQNLLWVDACDLIGAGQHTISFGNGEWESGFDYQAITDSLVSDNRHGFLHGDLIRNVHMRRIGSDAFHQPKLVVNCSVDGIDRGGTDWHPDVLQFATSNHEENHIFYGVRATNCKAQGIFAKDPDSVDNVAFVNVLIEGDQLKSQWGSGQTSSPMTTNHLLMWNVTITGQGFLWRGAILQNLSVRGCAFRSMGVQEPTHFENEWFQSNHFEEAASLAFGIDATRGPCGWIDAANEVYRPSNTSILRDRLVQPPVMIDADGNRRPRPASLGAYE